MSRPRGAVLGLVVAALFAVGAVGVAALRGIDALHAGQHAAVNTDRETSEVDTVVALGRFVVKHHGAEEAEAHRIDGALPPQVDDRSILASVVAAAAESGTTVSDEQRGTAATGGGGVVRVPVTLDMNAPTLAALVRFAGALEHQPRLFRITALEFTTAGGDGLHLQASVFTAPPAPPALNTAARAP